MAAQQRGRAAGGPEENSGERRGRRDSRRGDRRERRNDDRNTYIERPSEDIPSRAVGGALDRSLPSYQVHHAEYQ